MVVVAPAFVTLRTGRQLEPTSLKSLANKTNMVVVAPAFVTLRTGRQLEPTSLKSLAKKTNMVVVAQLVRALDCGSRGRGFKSRLPPILTKRSLSGLC